MSITGFVVVLDRVVVHVGEHLLLQADAPAGGVFVVRPTIEEREKNLPRISYVLNTGRFFGKIQLIHKI